ncbi:MAG: ABC transporter permease subunit [Candidatus Omnitrophota bacterium]|jgi:ABC-2 type transport system permease protein
MKHAFTVARKDFLSYLNSWIGVFVLGFFFLMAGLFFYLLVMTYVRISMNASQSLYPSVEGLGLTRFVYSSYFLNLSVVLLFFVPLLTMRSFAEEKRHQTLELLFTYPLSDFEIVWGKYLGMVWFFELMLLPTAVTIPLVIWAGGSIDWGPVVVGYLGFWLLGTAYLSLGLFVSSISENQVVSAMLTFATLIFLWALDWVAGVMTGPWAAFVSALAPIRHYREFPLGILDLSHIVYFCFFTLFFLFLSLRAVETRNWKG